MNKAEILRYMRTSSKTEDKLLDDIIEDSIAQINSAVTPRTLHRIFDCTVLNDTTAINGYIFKSQRLADTLKDCKSVCVFAATLGTEGDRLLRIADTRGSTNLLAMQAALSSKIEEVCDNLEEDLKSDGLSLRMRYSPGYFDLDISEQGKVFEMLDITKRIGITLTETYQMIPFKSVTAIIGIDDNGKN